MNYLLYHFIYFQMILQTAGIEKLIDSNLSLIRESSKCFQIIKSLLSILHLENNPVIDNFKLNEELFFFTKTVN